MMVLRAVAVVIVVVLVAAGLVYLTVRSKQQLPLEMSEIDDGSQLDDLHLDLGELDPSAWVRAYEPERSSPGYNLVLYRRRLPMLVDMNGHIVHTWPRVRAVGRVRLDRHGRLAVIGRDNLIKEYEWDGDLTWFFQLPNTGDFPHHDLIKLQNGNFLTPVREKRSLTDTLVEVDRSGEVVWEWRSLDHRKAFPTWDRKSEDPTHINSVHELPPNRWHDAGDDRFRPGNILVSARNLNSIFIVERASGDVVWRYSQGLDFQHEALMVKKGDFGDGLILVFNNGRDNLNTYRRSSIQAIDPVREAVEWEYGSEYFFSSVGGTEQKLPGSNVLITSSHGGRAFEITPEGDIVWEWVPQSYLPMRIERLPYDHCPQLAGLRREPETAVSRGAELPYIDAELYAFALAEERISRDVNGKKRQLVLKYDICRELLIPPKAWLSVEYGLDEERLRWGELSARFRLVLKSNGSSLTMVDDTVKSSAEELWRRRLVHIGRMSFQRVEMCLSVATEGGFLGERQAVVWGVPRIRSKAQHPTAERPSRRVTAEEEKVRRQQLEALGYVD